MLSPGRYWPETAIRLTVTFTDSNGDAVDPTTVTFETYSPCRTTSTYVYGTDSEVGKSAVGNYYADIEPGEPGRWHYRWKTTGSGTTIRKQGTFIIQDSKFVDPCLPDYC